MSEQQVTLGDLVRFVLEYRRGKAFYGYTEHQVASSILQEAHEGTMFYATDDAGKVTGIVVATKEENSKIMFVHDVLTIKPGILGRFVAKFRAEFPDYKLRAWRWKSEGRKEQVLTDYKTIELCNRLLKGAKI